MHSYADTFEQPVKVTIDGKDVTLPILSQRDLLPWIEEETKKRQETGRKNAPPAAVKDNARAKWMDWVDNFEVTPAALQQLVFRASGTIRTLQLSLKKAGLSEEAANVFIDSRAAKDNEMLAVRVCGLFRKEEIADLYPDPDKAKAQEEKSGDDPNDQPPV